MGIWLEFHCLVQDQHTHISLKCLKKSQKPFCGLCAIGAACPHSLHVVSAWLYVRRVQQTSGCRRNIRLLLCWYLPLGGLDRMVRMIPYILG